MRFSSCSRVLAILVLVAAWVVIPGCGGGGGGGVSVPNIPSVSYDGGGGGGGSVASPLSPATTPSAPSILPPRAARINAQAVQGRDGRTVSYSLPAGWSLISFPLEWVASTTGFTYQLYSYQGTGYVSVDPAANPGALDTSKAYWAYFDAPATVTVTGPDNLGAVTTAHLQAGWNLVGCPSTTALATQSMTVTRQAGATKVIEEAATEDLTAGMAWIFRYMFLYQAGQFDVQDLTVAGATLQPQAGHWVFAWTEGDLNLNVVPPSPLPSITALSTSALTAGGTVDITGTGLGTQATGVVVINGVPVPNENIVSWTSTLVRFTVPTGVSSGNLVVLVNRYPSNRKACTMSGGGGGGSTASLTGEVQSTAGVALSGAQIMVDTGQMAVSDASGSFRIDGIPAGAHLVYAMHIGYTTAVGQIDFTAGATKTVLVQLSPASGGGGGGGGGETMGNLDVKAYPYDSGGTRYWAYRIEIFEQGNYANRWSNTWYVDNGNTYNTWRADGAYVGRTYTIKITWRNANGDEHYNTWYRTLDSSSQTETFYSWN